MKVANALLSKQLYSYSILYISHRLSPDRDGLRFISGQYLPFQLSQPKLSFITFIIRTQPQNLSSAVSFIESISKGGLCGGWIIALAEPQMCWMYGNTSLPGQDTLYNDKWNCALQVNPNSQHTSVSLCVKVYS